MTVMSDGCANNKRGSSFSFQFPQFSSITHTNSNSKPNLTFLWSPIANRAKNINVTFYATLVQSHEIFWVKQPSNEINILVSDIRKRTYFLTNDSTENLPSSNYNYC
jgi:hypothetical protein